jgi:hypothetical protein
MKALQPLAIGNIGPAAGHVLKIPGIDQTYFQTGSLQNLERRDPLNAGRFHRHGLNPALVKPRGKCVQFPGEGAKGSHRLRVAIDGNGGKNLVGSMSSPAAFGFKMGIPSGWLLRPDRFVLRFRDMVRSPRLEVAVGGDPGRAER